MIGVIYLNKQKNDDFVQAHADLKLQAAEVSAFFDAKLEQHRVHSDMLAELYQTLALEKSQQIAWRVSNEHFSNTILAGFLHFPDESKQVSPGNWQMSEELLFQSRMLLTPDYKNASTVKFWGELYYDNVYHTWLLPYMTRVTNLPDGDVVWGSVMEVDNIISEVKKQFLGAGLELFIYDSNGRLVFHPDYGARLIRQNHTLGHREGDERIIRKSLRKFIAKDKVDGQLHSFEDWGKKVYAVTNHLESNDWTIVIYSQEDKIFKDTQQDITDILLIALLAVTFIYFTAVAQTRYMITRRLHHTSRILSSAISGHLDQLDEKRGGDEIDEVHQKLAQLF